MAAAGKLSEADVRAAATAGMSVRQTSRHLGVTHAAIVKWKNNLGLRFRPGHGTEEMNAFARRLKKGPKELRAVGEGDFGRMVTLGASLSFRTLLQRCKRKFGVRTLAVARSARRRLRRPVHAGGLQRAPSAHDAPVAVRARRRGGRGWCQFRS